MSTPFPPQPGQGPPPYWPPQPPPPPHKRGTPWWLIAAAIVVGAALLWGVGLAVSASTSSRSSSSAPEIPAEFRTPLGCDTRIDGECKDRMIFQNLCGLSIANMPSPQLVRTPRGDGTFDIELVYSLRGTPELSFLLTEDSATYTCLDNRESVILTKDEWSGLTSAGSEAELPPALR